MPYARLLYHLVWTTKAREPVIDDQIEESITWSFQKTCERLHIHLLAVGVTADHVHLAVVIPPPHSLSDVIRQLKGASSHAVNSKSGTGSFAWQREYAALTFSDRGLADVVAYVSNQKQRHAEDQLISGLERIE